jgi:hypothetical protein
VPISRERLGSMRVFSCVGKLGDNNIHNTAVFCPFDFIPKIQHLINDYKETWAFNLSPILESLRFQGFLVGLALSSCDGKVGDASVV